MGGLKIAILAVTVIMVGCTSTQMTTKGSSKIVERKYASQVSSIALNEIKQSTTCPGSSVFQIEKDYKKLMSYANACMSKQQWAVVDSLGERMQQVDSDMPWGAYYMSVASEGRGHIERAQWMINLALKKAPKVGLIRYQNGRILWNKKFLKEAIAEIESALELDPQIQDANIFLGQVHLRELKFDKSLNYFEKAYSNDKKNFAIIYGLSSCYIEIEKPQDALSLLQRGISLYPRSMDLRLQELFVYENQLKQLDTALSKYRELQALLAKNKIDGLVPFDIATKIKSLETTLSKRTLAKK